MTSAFSNRTLHLQDGKECPSVILDQSKMRPSFLLILLFFTFLGGCAADSLVGTTCSASDDVVTEKGAFCPSFVGGRFTQDSTQPASYQMVDFVLDPSSHVNTTGRMVVSTTGEHIRITGESVQCGEFVMFFWRDTPVTSYPFAYVTGTLEEGGNLVINVRHMVPGYRDVDGLRVNINRQTTGTEEGPSDEVSCI